MQWIGPLVSSKRIRFGSGSGFGQQSGDSQVDTLCRFGGGRSPEYLTSFSFLRSSCSTLWLRSLAPNCLNFSASWTRSSYYGTTDLIQPRTRPRGGEADARKMWPSMTWVLHIYPAHSLTRIVYKCSRIVSSRHLSSMMERMMSR